jgi:hypothetical protein
MEEVHALEDMSRKPHQTKSNLSLDGYKGGCTVVPPHTRV